MTSRHRSHLIVWIGAAALSLLSYGCGGHSSAARSSSSVGTATFVSGSGDPLPTAAPTILPSPTPSSTATPSDPVYSFRAEATGYTAVSFVVAARNILKVRFAPGIADTAVAGTNFTPNYSLMGVYIAVGGDSRATPPLYNGFGGTPAETSSIMDFSSAFPRTCSAADPACREQVTITVKQPNNNYWCLNFGMGCAWTHVYDTHPWNGTLTVQTDDTEAL